MKILNEKRTYYSKNGEISSSVRVKQLVEDENGLSKILIDGKQQRVINLTINKEDGIYNKDVIEWIFNQKDLSTSIKQVIKEYIKINGTGSRE